MPTKQRRILTGPSDILRERNDAARQLGLLADTILEEYDNLLPGLAVEVHDLAEETQGALQRLEITSVAIRNAENLELVKSSFDSLTDSLEKRHAPPIKSKLDLVVFHLREFLRFVKERTVISEEEIQEPPPPLTREEFLDSIRKKRRAPAVASAKDDTPNPAMGEATPNQPDPGEQIEEEQANLSIALDELGWKILNLFMREQDGHSILKKSDIDDKIAAAFKPCDATTVRIRLRALEGYGLLKDLGLKNGWHLTDEGRQFCTQHPEV